MKKTFFAGLSVLEPGEPLSDDNGAFTNRDPETTDRFLELGAKTHRHSGLTGIANPSATAVVSIIASGGALPPSTTLSLGYTFEDSDRGETMLSPVTAISTPGAIEAPTNILSAVVNTGAGELLVNTYYYAVTFVDGEGGETPIGPAVTVQRQPGFEHSEVELSGLSTGMAGAGAKGWRLYRAVGGAAYNLLATGTLLTFVDDGTHSLDCSTHPPAGSTNTTRGSSQLKVTLPTVPTGTAFVNVYASVTGDFSGGSRLGRFPAASGGHVAFFTTLELEPQQPPPVNRSVGTAHLIDPETELLEWHWKRPVASEINLPVGAGTAEGDVRLVEDIAEMFVFLGGTWEPISGGGGGTLPNATLAVFGQDDHPGLASGVIDDFNGGSISSHWHVAGSSAAPSGTWLQSGGHLRGSPGGSLVRDDTEMINGQLVVKIHTETNLFVQYAVYLGSPSEEGEEEYIFFNLTNGNDVQLVINGVFVDDRSITKLKENTDYWIRLTKRAGELTYELWATDPSLGGTAKFEWTYVLDVEDPVQNVMLHRHWFGAISYSGPGPEEPNGGYFDQFRAEPQSAGWVEGVELLELRGMTVTHFASGHAIVTASGGGGGGGGLAEISDGATTVEDATALEVVGSETADVELTEPAAGLAKVTVAAKGFLKGTDVFASGASPGHGPEGIDIEDSFPGSTFDSNWQVDEEGGGDPTTFWKIEGGSIFNQSGCPIIRYDGGSEDGEIIVHYTKNESPFFFTHAIFSFKDGTRFQVGWADGENQFKIGTESEPWASEPFTEAVNTEYWIRAVKEGKVIKGELWESDPTLGGSPVVTLEHELEEGEEGQAKFIGQELFPGIFGAGAPGGQVFDFTFKAESGEVGPDADYVKGATKIEFDGADVGHGSTGVATVVVPTADKMGFINCGEDLTKARPAYGCVTWMTEGKAEEEPEHMAELDLLVAINTGAAKQFIKVSGGLVEI